MSFSQHLKKAQDQTFKRRHRVSHLRSCAVHLCEKYKVKRSEILKLSGIQEQYRDEELPSDEVIEEQVKALVKLKEFSLPTS